MRPGLTIVLMACLLPACGGSTGSNTGPTDAPLAEDGSVAADSGARDGGATDSAAATDGPVQHDGAAQHDGAPQQDGGGPVQHITVVMASDIAESGRTQHARAAAALITAHAPAVSAVVLGGDNARYSATSLSSMLTYYNTYYDAAGEANWGQFESLVFPQAGNHENPAIIGNQGYFDYFATRMTAIKGLAGYGGFIDDTAKGYYSFNLNGWHFVSLNSNCGNVTGGCGAGSAQELWLKADLLAHPNMPIVAIWHAPRYACGGSHGDATEMQPLWADLVDARADFLFTGHNHYYERWKPLDKTNPEAVVDTANGVTQIVAGSYGVTTYAACSTLDARVQAALGSDPGMGVFFLTLGSDGSYSFEYQLISDGSIFDSGAGMSHHP
ncbi:MAG TPA: metallophosphoesterase [Polyangia bacterium]|jgi:hypothetical protein